MYNLIEPVGTADRSESVVARDLKLVTELAWLMQLSPRDLLRQISWKTGQRADTRLLLEGQPLPAATREPLYALLDERVRKAEEVTEQCRRESFGLVYLCIGFIVVARVMVAALT